MEGSNLLIKCAIIGDSKIGKSRLLQKSCQAVKHKNKHGYHMGKQKTVVKDRNIEFRVHDILKCSIPNALKITKFHYFIVCFDLKNYESYKSVGEWLNDVDRYSRDHGDYIVVGIENNSKGNRQVSYQEANNYVNSMSMFNMYVEVSTDTGENIDHLFHTIALNMLMKSDPTVAAETVEKLSNGMMCVVS